MLRNITYCPQKYQTLKDSVEKLEQMSSNSYYLFNRFFHIKDQSL